MNKHLSRIVLATVVAVSATTAQAVQVASFNTTFSGSETLWQGSGIPTAGFDESFTTGGAVGIKGRAVANTGTAAATVGGSISATFDEVVNSGSTAIKLNFNGGSSKVSSDFGASASLDAFVDAGILDVEFGLAGVGAFLEPERNFTANLGSSSGNASDQEEVTSVGSLDVFGVGRLGASVDLDFRQTISLKPTTIDGILAGVHRGTGTLVTQGFSMGSTDMTTVNLSLFEPGMWDFSILDVDLFSTFYNTASLVLEPTINYIIGDWSIASFNVPLITNSFALDFNTLERRNLFSILVTPVPAAIWLFGTALIGLVGFARRRKVA